MSLIPQPFIQLNMANGYPYSGAKAYFTQTGTTTAIAVYQDAALTTPHINPVVADSEGRFPAIFAPVTPALRMRIIAATGSLAAPMIDIDPVTTVSGSTVTTPGINLTLNANMALSVMNGGVNTSTADDVYDLDQWYSLTQTAACQVQQLAGDENGFVDYRRQTQNQAAAQRMGFAQILEGSRCLHLRGDNATLTPRVRISSGQKINYAILGWTGAQDTVTSDVVNNWTSAVFTPANFFLAANVAVLAMGSSTPNAATWTNLPALAAAMGSAFTNVVLFVWSDQVMAQNATLDCDYVMFEQGVSFTSMPPVDFVSELVKCQRYWFRKASAGGVQIIANLAAIGTSSVVGKFCDFPIAMRTSPIATISGGGLLAQTSTMGGTSAFSSLVFTNTPSQAMVTTGGLSAAILVAGNAVIITDAGPPCLIDFNARL